MNPAVEPPVVAPPRRSWTARIVLVLLAAVAIPVGFTVLHNFPPSEYSFYPRCFFHWLTGLHCPGCGATRCMAALAHGDVAQAFAYNPLFMLALPWLVFVAVRMGYETWTGKPLMQLRVPGWGIKILFVVIIAYWIARNIDVYPLSLLAPHEI
jgi:hypothetical protein